MVEAKKQGLSLKDLALHFRIYNHETHNNIDATLACVEFIRGQEQEQNKTFPDSLNL